MIEQAHNLLECEAILSKQATAINLLGELNLTRDDLDVLTRLLQAEMAPDWRRAVRYLEQQAPTCLACFLVGMGTYSYQKHSFWLPVMQALGLEPDPAVEQQLGNAFLRYLERHDLPRVEIPGSLKFVTPILLHGGIPNACLPEYFEELLLTLVKRDGIDPSDLVEISQELAIRREIERQRVELDAQHKTQGNQVANRKKNARTLRQMAEVIDDFAVLHRLESDLKVHHIPDGIPENYLSYRTSVLERIEELHKEFVSLNEETKRLGLEPEVVSEQDIRVLSFASDIESCISGLPELKQDMEQLDQLRVEVTARYDRLCLLASGVLSQPWSDDYCKPLQDLPSGELVNTIEKLEMGGEEYDRIQLLEQQNALAAIGNSSWVVPVVMISAGVGMLVLGLERSAPAIVLPGVAILAAGAGLAWSRYRKQVERNKRSGDIARQLRISADSVNELKTEFSRTLSRFPIQQVHLAAPSRQWIQDLSDLAAECTQVSLLRGRCIGLEGGVLQRLSLLERILTEIGLPSQSTIEGSVALLTQALGNARRRQAETDQTNEERRVGLQSRMILVEGETNSLKADLAHKEGILAKLADGQELGRALNEIETIRQDQQVAIARRRELEKQCRDLPNLEPMLERAINQGLSKHDLTSMADAFWNQALQTQAEVRSVAAKLNHFPAVFPGIDEPIRRFILYGGDTAEQFLLDSLWRIHRAMSGAQGEDNRASNLPDRVKEAFQPWWAERKERASADAEAPASPDPRDGGRLHKPYLLFDPGAGDIAVILPGQRISSVQDFSSDGVEVILEIGVPNQRSSTARLPLRVYQLSQGRLETEMVELPVSVPASEYQLSLSRNGQTIGRWIVPGLVGDPPWLAFDWRSNRRLGQDLSAGKVWLITRKDITIKQKQSIIEELPLFGKWQGYLARGLDLTDEDTLELMGEDDIVWRVPIAVAVRSDPEVSVTKQVEQVFSNGMQVFSALPELTIPRCSMDDLMQWRLSILPIVEGEVRRPKHYRFSDLPEDALRFHSTEDVVDVRLDSRDLLGAEAFGAYELRVRKSPFQPWTTTFAVIPSLSVGFGKPLYLPTDNSRQTTVEVMVTLQQSLTFEPSHPAKLMEKDSMIHLVETQLVEDGIIGLIGSIPTDESRNQLPVSIMVPKLRWRLEGVPESSSPVWESETREIWLGDLGGATELSFVVSVPPRVEGTVRLGLNPSGTETQARTLRQGKARFDLVAFGDALRRGPAMQRLVLTSDTAGLQLRSTELLRVRTRWEAQDIQCVQELRGRNVVLTVSWSEEGRIDGKEREIRLWRLEGRSPELVLTTKELDGNCGVLQESMHMLRPGSYLLEVVLMDPWSTTTPAPPKHGAPGSQLIEISHPGDIRQGEKFLIRSIMNDQGRVLSLASKPYRIEIIGKIVNKTLPQGVSSDGILVTHTNEGWYVGILQVEGVPDLAAELDTTNPVKFQYVAATDQLTAVEDRYGEGAMYCANCRRMFWSQETNLKEQSAGHELIGPIEVFKVKWESQRHQD